LQVSLADSVHAHGWLWLTPVDVSHSSYSASVALLGMLMLGGVAFWLLHPKGTNVRRSVAWSCGNPHTHARMQYNATSFSQPLRRIFAGIYRAEEHVRIERNRHKLLTDHVSYVVHVGDMAVKYIYQPVDRFILFIAKFIQHEHERGLHAYLAYTLLTIIFLLAVYI